jgi:hypothetical protein
MATEYERAFLREYLPAAWDRFDEHDAVEAVHFWRFGNAVDHDPPAELAEGVVLDDGGVILVVTGDPDPTPAVEAERDRWQRLREDGLLDSWTVEPWDGPHSNAREKIVDNLGSVGGDRSFRLRQVAAGTTVELLREFETDLPAVADATEDNPTGVGDWVLIHYLMKQNGHDWYDEIDACRKAIENRAWSLAAFYDHATARDAVETAIDELRAVHSELEEPDGSTPERPGSTPDGG